MLTTPGGNPSPFPELAEEECECGEDLRLHPELVKNCLSLPSLLLSVSYSIREREEDRVLLHALLCLLNTVNLHT